MTTETLEHPAVELTIGEASRAIGISAGYLRVLEERHVVPEARRAGKIRVYSVAEVEDLRRRLGR